MRAAVGEINSISARPNTRMCSSCLIWVGAALATSREVLLGSQEGTTLFPLSLAHVTSFRRPFWLFSMLASSTHETELW